MRICLFDQYTVYYGAPTHVCVGGGECMYTLATRVCV